MTILFISRDRTMQPLVHFAIPGDLSTLTGGYGYDRRMIAELNGLGFDCRPLSLPGGFPEPDEAALARSDALLAALPDDSLLIVDGLALGTLDDSAHKHARRLRLVSMCHHPLALESGLSPARAERLRGSEQRALSACRAVIVTSPATREILIRDYAVAPDNITVAVPGTDPQPFAPCTGNPPQLLTMATITPRKGHDVLINALADIRHLPWSARFVGGDSFDPAWASALKEQVREHGLDERITFVGETSEPDTEYRRADLFVLPSRYEGYGMVFAEAIACGLPVVATRVGAAADLVSHKAGILLPVDDTAALGSALARILGDDDYRSTLQQGARAAAARLPQWQQSASLIAERLLQVGAA